MDGSGVKEVWRCTDAGIGTTFYPCPQIVNLSHKVIIYKLQIYFDVWRCLIYNSQPTVMQLASCGQLVCDASINTWGNGILEKQEGMKWKAGMG